MKDSIEKLQKIHMEYDGETVESGCNEKNNDFNGEKEFLKALGEEIRRDTKEMEQQISFPNMTSNIMSEISSKDSLFDVVLHYLKRNSLAFAGVSACLLVVAVAYLSGGVNLDSLTRKSDDSLSNECIIESIENKNSTSLVLKEEAEDPVTIIWVFENSDTGKM